MRSNSYLVVFIIALLSACSSTPTSHVIIPSRNTVDKIVELNHRSDVVVDVLTVDRTEHWLKLNGASGSALSGRDLMPDNHSDTSSADQLANIPFDQLALVYYQKVPTKQTADLSLPTKSDYPSLPEASTQDRQLTCAQLDLDLSRAGAIRWYARTRGAEPFTDHGARVQHGKNVAQGALFAIAAPVAVALIVVDPLYALFHPWPDVPQGASPVTFRWAVTAADRREIGLLEIKRDRSCPAQPIPGTEVADLDILNQIESSRAALAAHQISDHEQMDQQTQLLDRFDPPAPSQSAQVANTSP